MTYQQKLQSIIKATGWSQEKLASELNTSFPTLNSWINSKSKPRKKALEGIDSLFVQIVGSDVISDEELKIAKNSAVKLGISTGQLVNDQEALDRLILHLTYHTNTIEGSTMTLADVEEVLFNQKVLSNRTAIEQTEARNHQAALLWLLDIMAKKGADFKITEKLVLDLHVRLMNGLISNAGQYRRHGVRILGSSVALSNWQKIPEKMNELIGIYQITPEDIIDVLARSHALFEQIHPFSDGNGRAGRLLMLAQALQFSMYPPLVQRERKQAYYKYLQIAQTEKNYKPLELFVAQSVEYCAKTLNLKKV